ncbi:MAG: DUF805 domain-containing protein [Pseudomonadota bacterium]
MGPLAAIATCLAAYRTFDGRASRPEFWWFFGLVVLLGFGAMLVDGGLGFDPMGVKLGPFAGVPGALALQAPVSTLVEIAVLSPLAAAMARRLHDVGSSGWLQAPIWAFILIEPAVAYAMPLTGASPAASAHTAGILLMACYALWLVRRLAKPSDPAANRHGPPPSAPAEAAA